MPLVYRPGELAEVDFFEVLIDVLGERTKAQLFVMRLMQSGRDFAWLYERQDQVSFLEYAIPAVARDPCKLRKRWFDLLPLVRKHAHDPAFRGSFSI